MFTELSAMNSSLTLYGTEYTETRAAYLLAAKNLTEATITLHKEVLVKFIQPSFKVTKI